MIKLFKLNGIGQLIPIIGAVVLLWAKVFISPLEMPSGFGYAPLYDLVYSIFSSHCRIASAIALVLIVLEGLWINVLFYNHKMLQQNTLMPAFFFIVAMSFAPSSRTLTPLLLANIAIIPATRQMMVHEDLNITLDNIFNSALLISIATMLYLPAVALIIPLMISFSIHKLYRWRHWVMMLLGFLAPIIIAATVYFLTDRLYYIAYLAKSDIFHFPMEIGALRAMTVLKYGAFILLTLVVLFKYFSFANERVTIFRKNASIVTVILIASIIMHFYDHLFPIDPQTAAIPFAFLATGFFLSAKRKIWVYELIIFLLVAVGMI